MSTNSTAAAVLPFPQRNKGRVRKSESLMTMGECALNHFCKGDPENIVRLSHHKAESIPDADVSLLLSAVIFAGLSKTKQANLRKSLKSLCARDPRAVVALRLLA